MSARPGPGVEPEIRDLDTPVVCECVDHDRRSSIRTLRNRDGEGRFTPVPVDAAGVGLNPRALVLGDLNGDGRADAIVTFQGENAVGICLSQGSAPFYPAGSFTKHSVQRNPAALDWADVNGDGRRDLLVLNSADASVSRTSHRGSRLLPL